MKPAAPLVGFACEANVCRSPLSARLFETRLARAGVADDVRITSAGSVARPDLERCSWAPPALDGVEPSPALSEDMTPVQVTGRLLDEASVWFAADQQVQAALIRLSPSARSRTFTIKEAAALSRLVVAAVDRNDELSSRGLDWLVAEMDAARGWLPIDTSHRRRRLRRTPYWSKTFDVPDAHTSGKAQVQHPQMFSELDPALDELAGSVVRILSAGNPATSAGGGTRGGLRRNGSSD